VSQVKVGFGYNRVWSRPSATGPKTPGCSPWDLSVGSAPQIQTFMISPEQIESGRIS